jgi:hypothetical protein
LSVFVVSAILASGCGASSPTAPESTAPGTVASGTWKGAFQITSCTGATDGTCQSGPETFVLRLGSAGGVLQIDTKIWHDAPPIAVTV